MEEVDPIYEEEVVNVESVKKLEDEEAEKDQNPSSIRNIIAFAILGLLNNFYYVVFLSAAEDLSKECTGCILLANIIPSLAVGLVAPFFMHFIPYDIRIGFCCLFSIMSIQFVAWFDSFWLKLVGIVLAAIATGFGEIVFLAMVSFYNKDVMSGWGIGTGGAGIFGSLAYLALKGWLGLTQFWTLQVISPLPLILFGTTLFGLTGEHHAAGYFRITKFEKKTKEIVETEEEKPKKKFGFLQQLIHLKNLIPYMAPLFLVYIAEYLINSGVLAALKFPNAPKAIHEDIQYVYYQFLYQIGVFISRSSISFIRLENIWLQSIIQCCIFVYLFFDALFRITPNIGIIFAIILFEGLLGGSTYVNAYYRITQEIEEEKREYSMSMTSLACTVGISMAGVLSIPLLPFLREHQDPECQLSQKL
eukprot:gene4735-8318_t